MIPIGKTSSKVKYKYNSRVYSVVKASLDKQLVTDFKQALSEDEISTAEFLRRAIKEYLANRERPAD